ncbi:protein IQ-DOMAIN 32-like [Dorcoceras hygrometricum]|uniref:Protein IQ-DOMAIN 32-like n=1 Tax=Dorcoceras hygrometricum TaxID=472368 RepID=A0A2Z7DJM4_9LAMI|nr:protein IQ-DOMAIN 32-like [Dorcoceras hygrometricum]
MTFRVVRTNQYNQYLGLIHSTNGNHLESPKEGSSIDHQAVNLILAHHEKPLRIPVPVHPKISNFFFLLVNANI